MKTNTIPPDQASWLSFRELDDRNEAILRQILEKAEVNDSHRNAIDHGCTVAGCEGKRMVASGPIAQATPP